MASTDAKSGFRLPWSTDRNDSDDQTTTADDQAVDQAQPQGAVDQTAPTAEATPPAGETAPAQGFQGPANEGAAAATPEPGPSAQAPATATAAPSRRPNKFMADLTKAMQTAAEAARADVLEKVNAEAKAHIEGIHASTADEATKLRKRADEDVAAIREWSKNEIARIREETDERIAHRKDVLEREIEAHAAHIEARIDHVQSRVTAFESEMAVFFERLLAEEDPTRFAAMAETLPEPVSLDDDADIASSEWSTPVQVEAAPDHADTQAMAEDANADASDPEGASPVAESTGWESDVPVSDVPVSDVPVSDVPVSDWAVTDAAVAEGAGADTAVDTTLGADGWQTQTPVDDAPNDAQSPNVEASAEPAYDDAGDLFSMPSDTPVGEAESVVETEPVAETDPRLSALGFEGDFASAEAEAAAFTAEPTTDEQEIPTIAEDALAARLAGLVADDGGSLGEAASTRVIVTGLVSVASIAGFKRNLARAEGVRSVGVSSGPDGEFVFAVNHDPGLDLSSGITTLPGFGARVTNEAPGELTVAARDPESES
jgi:hypothetical protein